MTDQRPNIVFILTDQQSANMMGCAGNRYVKTPAMDFLAAHGVNFNRAYCTNPVCCPSRFSLMTGLYPSTIGMRSNYEVSSSVPQEIVRNSLGHLMRQAGYETAYGGKVHLPPDLQPEKAGFEVLTADSRDILAEKAADFIRRTHKKPYFLYASFINPHDICYMAIKAFATRSDEQGLLKRGTEALQTLHHAIQLPKGVSEEEFFKDICPPLPPNFEPQEDEPEAIDMIRKQRPFKLNASKHWTEKEWRLHRRAYCRLTEIVDAQISKLIEAIRTGDDTENTVIIFSSDHGDSDGAHRMEHKTMLYEEPSRIPLIISQPGTSSGAISDNHLVSNGLDLLPTLCDYAGVELPEGIGGRSLRPLAEGRKPDSWRDHIFVESEFGSMIRTEKFKFVRYDAGKNREQLYDMVRDPYETRNFLNEDYLKNVVSKHRILMDKSCRSEKFQPIENIIHHEAQYSP